MQSNVYLTIDGTKHARLIYYYMVLVYCGEKDNSLKVHFPLRKNNCNKIFNTYEGMQINYQLFA